MVKKTNAASPAKSKSTTPIIRRQEVILYDNQFIPSSFRDGQDGQHGRVLAFDVKTEVSPVLTSSRTAKKPTNDKTVDDMDLLMRGLANVTIQDDGFSTPTKKARILPDMIRSAPSGKKKKDIDEEWTETDSATAESVSAKESYDEDDEDDLAWSIKDSDDEGSISPDDLYSPERAKGLFQYTIHDDSMGAVYNIRRSSRTSFGSPAGKKK